MLVNSELVEESRYVRHYFTSMGSYREVYPGAHRGSRACPELVFRDDIFGQSEKNSVLFSILRDPWG